MADFHGSIFEPENLPSARGIAGSLNLDGLNFSENPDALVQLIDTFQKNGFREQERQTTYALRRSQAERLQFSCSSALFNASECGSYVLQTTLFNLTCEYGMEPFRPLKIILFGIGGFTFLYYFLIHFKSRSTLILVVKSPKSSRERTVQLKRLRFKKSGIIYREIKFFHTALLLSLMSTFNLGFREIDFGKWLRMLARRDYEIRPRGVFRTLSGLQSLLGLYLLALSVLVFYGNPFR